MASPRSSSSLESGGTGAKFAELGVEDLCGKLGRGIEVVGGRIVKETRFWEDIVLDSVFQLRLKGAGTEIWYI